MPVFDTSNWGLTQTILVFLIASLAIGIAGTRLTRIADRLADLTGMGEAIFGAVLLGAATSLSGSVTSMVTAYQGFPALAVSNSVGGIAAQTTFLVLADLCYRKANLEHAAASLENLVQAALLMVLLCIPLLTALTPAISFAGVHPASIVILVVYLIGLHLMKQARSAPLWHPRQTSATRLDEPEESATDAKGQLRVWLEFGFLVVLLACAGLLVAKTGIGLVEQTSLSETVVGFLFTAVATSLPELVTTVAAVRQGALTLAVSGIIGGNTFDVLFLTFSDISYRQGSIYHAIGARELLIISVCLLLTGIILLGLLSRQRRGPANIGFESVLVLLVYLASLAYLFTTA